MSKASIPDTKADGLRPVCALYMRVSTKGHGQTTDTQAMALREYAERRGFEIVGILSKSAFTWGLVERENKGSDWADRGGYLIERRRR